MTSPLSTEQMHSVEDVARRDAVAMLDRTKERTVDAELFGTRARLSDGSYVWMLTFKVAGHRITVDGQPNQRVTAVLTSLLSAAMKSREITDTLTDRSAA